MKIRNGFVSNSSSSSFIVIFPIEPKSIDDVKNLLFEEGQELYLNPYYDEKYYKIDSKAWSVNVVANTVWSDICEQKKNDIQSVIEDMASGYLDGKDAPKSDDFNYITDWSKSWQLYDYARERYSEMKLKKFFNINKKEEINEKYVEHLIFYIFRYADEDGSYYAALEHGNLFRYLKHIKISHH